MNQPSIRLAFVIVALALGGAVIVGDLVREARGRRLRETILAELQPVALKNCTLKRFGSANDGGYLMCENLIEPIDAAYSYGVGSNDDWGCEVSRRYHVPVHGTIVLIPHAHSATAAPWCFIMNAWEIEPVPKIPASLIHWKTSSEKTDGSANA